MHLDRKKWHDHKIPTPQGARSSVLEAPVTGSIPFEEVASNLLAGKSLNARRSRFPLSRQYVKGGISSSYASMSHTQSAPSSSVSSSLALPQNQHSLYSSPSLLQLQGSLSPSVQDIASQSGFQLGETSSPLSAHSSSSTGSSAGSLSEFTYISQGSSGPQLASHSSQLVSTDGVSDLLPQPQSTASQNIPGSSVYTKLAASPLSVSQSTSGQSSYSQYTSDSQRRLGNKLAASRQYVPTLDSSYGSSFQPQGTTRQYAPTFSFGAKVPVSSRYYPAALSGSSQSLSQSPQKWQPSTPQYPSRFVSLSSASADGFSLQLQGTSSQYAPASLDEKVPVYSQAAPSGFSLSMSQPSQLKPSTSRWSQGFQASGTVASQGSQTSGTATSQSNSPSQGSKSPSRFSTLTSAASPSQSFSNMYTSSSLSRAGAQLAGSSRYVPMLTGSTSTDGSFLRLQGTSSQYAPASLVAKVPPYKPAAPSGSSSLSQPSQWQPSTSRWSQGFQAAGTVASQSSSLSQGSKSTSRFSTLTPAASPGKPFSTRDGSGRYSGLFSQSQSASSQYAPAAFDAKVPVYSQAAPSGFFLSPSQPSQWQPSTSRWSQGFQAAGTVASQSRSPSQGSKSTSRLSTLNPAARPGQSFSNLYTSSSISRAGAQLAGSSHYLPMQTGSTSTDGSSLQLQGTSSQYAPASLVAKVPPYKPAAPSGSSSLSQPSQWQPSTSRWSQGFQAAGTVASQSSSPSQGSKSTSRFSTLTPAASPGKLFFTQDGSGRYSGLFSQSQSASSQYAPATLDVKVPVYSQAAPSGFFLSPSQPSQWQPSTSRWSQGFQATGTVASQSSSPSQGSKSTSRLSTLNPAARPGQSFSNLYTSSSISRAGAQLAGSSHYVPMQTGSTSTDGSSLQLQGTSSQYAPASLVAKVPPYKPAAPSGSSSLSQPSQWQPSTRWSQGFQASGTVASQSSSPSQGSKSTSRFSTLTPAASPGKLFFTQDGSGRYSGLFSQSQSASSQYAPATLDVKVPLYSQAAPSGFFLSPSQPSQWQPSTSRWSQGFQATGTVASQSRSPSQGSKSTSRLSTLTPAARPGQSFSNLYTSSSISRAGAQLAGSSHYVPMQTGSTSTDGSSLQLQGTSSQYAPASLVAKVPPYKPAAPSGSSSLSQPSQWQPSTRWSQGFQASGTVASQSSSPSQGSKSTSRFSTLTPAASPGKLFFTQDGSGRYSGLFSQSQSASSQYAPATLDVKVPVYSQAAPSGFFLSPSQPSQWQPSTSRWSQGFQAAGTVASQSSSPSQGSKSTSRLSTLTPAASPGKPFSTQDGSGRYSGLFSQSQSTSRQYAPAFLVAKVHPYKLAAPSKFASHSQLSQWQPSTSRWSQGFQASGTVASQSSSSSQGSKSPSRLSTLISAASPGESFSTQAGSGRYSGLSSQSPSASNQYNPGSPAYAKHGFSFLDSSRQSTSDQSSFPQFSSGSSFMAALSHPVDSVAQSSISNSWRTSSLSGVGLRPSMLSKAASGSINHRPISPSLLGSVQYPTDSSTYGQKPSQTSSTSGRYLSSVKG
ncbi:uncharacterized protein LOC143709659 isoform X2 [Siphateles boraxobius]|uniref:uncharacterized protein LOC143709659 isoform X2 n=1 Tax=Siphateles boraxobius TaxID=180520 RepID=UPI004062A870